MDLLCTDLSAHTKALGAEVFCYAPSLALRPILEDNTTISISDWPGPLLCTIWGYGYSFLGGSPHRHAQPTCGLFRSNQTANSQAMIHSGP